MVDAQMISKRTRMNRYPDGGFAKDGISLASTMLGFGPFLGEPSKEDVDKGRQ